MAYEKRWLAPSVVVLGIIAAPNLAMAQASDPRDDGYHEDGVRLAASQPPPAWSRPVDVVNANKWDAGGAVLVPTLAVPIFVTDPFGAKNIGQSAATSVGYGVQWRAGVALGSLSILPLAGYSRVSRGAVQLPNGSSADLSLSRAYLGGELRYTAPLRGVVHPFIGVGATADYWSASRLFRAGRRSADVDGMWTPSAMASAGLVIRVVRIGARAAVFIEVGAYGSYTFEGAVFEEGQVAISPFLGLDVLGLFGGKS